MDDSHNNVYHLHLYYFAYDCIVVVFNINPAEDGLASKVHRYDNSKI